MTATIEASHRIFTMTVKAVEAKAAKKIQNTPYDLRQRLKKAGISIAQKDIASAIVGKGTVLLAVD